GPESSLGPTAAGSARIILGALLISTAAAVKINALVALGFFAVMIARRVRASYAALFRAGTMMLLIAAITLTALSLGSGLGFGWIGALITPRDVLSWISPLVGMASLTTGVSNLFGIGDQAASLHALQPLGAVLAAGVTGKFLRDGLRQRHHAMVGLGVSLGAFMLLNAGTQPWWLLWAVVPLATTTAATARHRRSAAAASVLVALLVFPTGGTLAGRIPLAVGAYLFGALVVGVTVVLLRRTIPDRVSSWSSTHRILGRREGQRRATDGNRQAIPNGDRRGQHRPRPATGEPVGPARAERSGEDDDRRDL